MTASGYKNNYHHVDLISSRPAYPDTTFSVKQRHDHHAFLRRTFMNLLSFPVLQKHQQTHEAVSLRRQTAWGSLHDHAQTSFQNPTREWNPNPSLEGWRWTEIRWCCRKRVRTHSEKYSSFPIHSLWSGQSVYLKFDIEPFKRRLKMRQSEPAANCHSKTNGPITSTLELRKKSKEPEKVPRSPTIEWWKSMATVSDDWEPKPEDRQSMPTENSMISWKLEDHS